MWNFITADRFENIGREKKGGGALNPPLTTFYKVFKNFV
jgi:hypothetical protein